MMAKEDLANVILEERINIGAEILGRLIEKFKWKLSDYERADLSVRMGINLAIEKNKTFRTTQIDRRGEKPRD